jgi:Flagellar motor switch protein
MTKLFIDPWENVIELNPKLNKIETNSQFAQIVSPNETVALITIKVNIGDVEGLINLCMPHLLIEPILPKLSTKLWFTNNTKKITHEQEAVLKERLKRAEVEISCHVGEANITVGEFLTLQEGDVIKLASRTSDELTIMVGEKIKYFGKPGSLNKNLAVKITQVIEEGDNGYDE